MIDWTIVFSIAIGGLLFVVFILVMLALIGVFYKKASEKIVNYTPTQKSD